MGNDQITPTPDETPIPDVVEPAAEAEAEAEEPQGMTILDATAQLAEALMRISKKTKMSETGVMNIYSFFFSQEEAARNRAQQERMIAEAAEEREIAGKAHLDLPAQEIITAND